MQLRISVDLLTGSYEAGDVSDRREGEWPPHPARLFCALVAAVRDDAERDALQLMEALPAPSVLAAGETRDSSSRAFVVTNKVSQSGGSQFHPGRSNQLRSRARTFPRVPRVQLVWDVPEASANDLAETLDRVCARVPYVGRATGTALVSAAVHTGSEVLTGENADDPAGDLQLWEPCDVTEADTVLRVPYPGYLTALTAQFERDAPSWQVRTPAAAYRRVRPAPEAPDPTTPSAYSDLLVFRFDSWKPEGRLAPRFTEALRSKVLRNAQGSAPAVLHGHGADGRPHVAFLALPHVGHDKAHGHLLGLAVAVPELPVAERAAVLRAAFGEQSSGHREDRVLSLSVPGIGETDLIYSPGLYRPWALSPDRWRKGSKTWVSATPVVLDRYPKRGLTEADIVRRCLTTVGAPNPVQVKVSAEPFAPGAVRLEPGDLPRQARGRIFRHVEVTFPHVVAGPLLVGAGRYLGVGLMAPRSDAEDAS